MHPARIHLSLLLALAATLSSCASIFAGSSSNVQVTSTPSGAKFTSSAGVSGVTPAAVSLPNGLDVSFSFEGVDGYEPAEHVSHPRMSGWIVGNILLGGIVGLIVDIVNPDTRVHKDIRIELTPSDNNASADEGEMPGEVEDASPNSSEEPHEIEVESLNN